MVAAATYKETLTINSSLKIFGAGAATTIIDGYQGVFIQQDNAIVTLSGLTIRNGLAGINNSGKLTLDDSTISGVAGGGGIANYGTMTVNRCTIRGNVGAGFDGYYSAGGGIYNSGVLTINSSTISENDAEGNYVCGGGIYNSGTLTVNNATLNRNHARGDSNSVGGGIENDGGMVVLSNSTLEGNSAVIHEYGDGIGRRHRQWRLCQHEPFLCQHDDASEHYCCEQCTRGKLQWDYDLDGLQPQQRQNLQVRWPWRPERHRPQTRKVGQLWRTH